jgi:hypothetical protein
MLGWLRKLLRRRPRQRDPDDYYVQAREDVFGPEDRRLDLEARSGWTRSGGDKPFDSN